MLVLGAAGGVGVAAVQISKVLGAKVVAVARGESKAKLLRDLGADAVIDTSANHQVRHVTGASLSPLQMHDEKYGLEPPLEAQQYQFHCHTELLYGCCACADGHASKCWQHTTGIRHVHVAQLASIASGRVFTIYNTLAMQRHKTLACLTMHSLSMHAAHMFSQEHWSLSVKPCGV